MAGPESHSRHCDRETRRGARRNLPRRVYHLAEEANWRSIQRIGLLPATISGIGMILLSELDDERIGEIYADKPEIPNFPGGMPQLMEKIAEVRRLGYARVHVADDRDHHVVAMSSGDPAHVGIALSGWIPEASTPALVEALRQAAIEFGG